MSSRILIVQDDSTPNQVKDQSFLQETFHLSSIRFHDFISQNEQIVSRASQLKPDLLLMDIGTSAERWFELCNKLRIITDAPIILLIPQSIQIDRIQALEIGADDYMVKPVRNHDLLLLLRAHLYRVNLYKRRSEAGDLKIESPYARNQPAEDQHEDAAGFLGQDMPLDSIRRMGNVVIDLEARKIQRSDVWYSLKPMEFALLLFFIRNQGITFSRIELLNAVWGKQDSYQSRTVDVHIRWLRKKVEDDPNMPTRITTVRGIGYRFNG